MNTSACGAGNKLQRPVVLPVLAGLVFSAVLAGAALSVEGCAQKGSSQAAPPPSATASAAPSASSPSARASASGALPPPPAPNGANNPSGDPMATLFGSMADELKNRPDVHPNVDEAFAALATAGVWVDAPAQSLGRTYKASYCKHGLASDKTMSVLLCEYADPAHAALGLEESKKVFPTLKTRETYTHKSLVIATTIQGEQHPAVTAAAQKKVIATFKAL